MKKKILVTGAAGFVGSHLVPQLKKEGHDITANIKNKEEKKLIAKNTKILICDLSQKGDWTKALKTFDIIIHLAAQISSKYEDDFTKNNVVATKNLIEAAKSAKVKKIIHFSSAAVNSIRRDPYSNTKAQQEKMIIGAKIPYFIIRPSMMYGPGDTKNIGWLIKIIKALPIIPLPGGGNYGRQPIFINDICKIVSKLIENPETNKIYEIHGHQYITTKDMVSTIKKQLRLHRPTLTVPIFLLKLYFFLNQKLFTNPKFTVDQVESITSGEKFKGDKWWDTFDIIPTTFTEGVAQMVKK